MTMSATGVLSNRGSDSHSGGGARVRRASGSRIAIAGLALAFVATYLPLWDFNNPWIGGGRPIDPSLPGTFYGGASVNWWGVLGPDVAERVRLITALLVTWVPVAIVALSAFIPLTVERLRPSFGPLVLVTASMWAGQVVMWAALSNDNHDGWSLEVGGYLLLLGLVISIIGAMLDLVSERERTSPLI
jgi:hypothetical protein